MVTIDGVVRDKKGSKKGKVKDLAADDSTKRRKRTDGQPAKGKDASQGTEETGSPPSMHSKKKKRQKNEEAPNDHMDVEPTRPDMKKVEKNKKKRKRDAQEDMAEPDTSTRINKKPRKTQEVQQEARRSPDPAADNESGKKTKKKREKKKSSESTTKIKPQLEETANEKPEKQKKRKNKTGFPDPEEDVGEGELSDQAKKALSYAFKKYHESDLWKFNKAKQNWLVRNFWSLKAIPEKYDGLAIKYLSAAQGNARENLVKTCREVIETQPPPPPNEEQDPQMSGATLGGPLIDVTSPKAPTEAAKKKARAQALLRALISESDT